MLHFLYSRLNTLNVLPIALQLVDPTVLATLSKPLVLMYTSRASPLSVGTLEQVCLPCLGEVPLPPVLASHP